MKGPLVGLCRMQGNTSFAPLAALGYYLRQQDFFAPIRHEVKLKTDLPPTIFADPSENEAFSPFYALGCSHVNRQFLLD